MIVSLAEEHGVQLIVMGLTGAQGIQDAFAPRLDRSHLLAR